MPGFYGLKAGLPTMAQQTQTQALGAAPQGFLKNAGGVLGRGIKTPAGLIGAGLSLATMDKDDPSSIGGGVGGAAGSIIGAGLSAIPGGAILGGLMGNVGGGVLGGLFGGDGEEEEAAEKEEKKQRSLQAASIAKNNLDQLSSYFNNANLARFQNFPGRR